MIHIAWWWAIIILGFVFDVGFSVGSIWILSRISRGFEKGCDKERRNSGVNPGVSKKEQAFKPEKLNWDHEFARYDKFLGGRPIK